VWLVNATNKVLPSGADRATSCAAMFPPAPGLFSTMIDNLDSLLISSASTRASVSVVPPGDAPTMNRTVWPDFPCAWDGKAVDPSIKLPASSAGNKNFLIDLPFKNVASK
jgi:hypothetical protein